MAKTDDVVLLDERRRHVVLGRQRVRGAEHDVRAAGLERPRQVGGLGRDVQAGRDAVAGQRLLALEALADRGEHRHLPVGPRDPADALGGEGQVLDVVALVWWPSALFSLESSVRHAASSRSCFRCSQSTQRCGRRSPWSQVSTLGPERRTRGAAALRTRRRRARRRSARAARAASAAGRARQRRRAGTRRGPRRHDEPERLEVAQHPRRPARLVSRLSDRHPSIGQTLPQVWQGCDSVLSRP